jgi:hypothetical protein
MTTWILHRLAVGSSDWLGLSSHWWWLRTLELCMMGEFVVMCICVGILVEAYREYRKDNGENEQADGETDYPSSEYHQPPRGNLSQLRRSYEYSRLSLRNLRVGVDVCRANTSDFLLKARDFFLKLLGIRSTHRPNETELSHRWRERVWQTRRAVS